jgi:hypothetical protein
MSGDHHLQERRVSARRGSVNRALCSRSRVLFGGDRSDNQSGGRQPAVVRRTERCAVATALCSTFGGRPTTKSGGRQPAVVRRTERCERAMFDDDRTDDQERRVLARRGYRYR